MFDTECSYNLSLHSRLSYIESSNSNLRKQLRKQRCSSFAYAKSLPCEILLNALFVDLLVANALFFDTHAFHKNQGKTEENGLWLFTKIEYGPNFNYIDSNFENSRVVNFSFTMISSEFQKK